MSYGAVNGFIFEPASEYHAKADQYLSSHQLIDYMRSPYGYWYKHNAPSKQHEPSAFFMGRAVHKYILEGADEFEKEYTVNSEQVDGRIAVSENEFNLIKTANDSVRSHGVANKLLSNGFAEGVIRTEYCGIDCQIRLDWVNSEGIVDLKTCRNLDKFAPDFREYWYANQMSFYREVYKAQFGRDVQMWLVAVELSVPYRTGVFLVSEETLEEARKQNEEAIPRFIQSRESGIYPTLYEETRIL